MTQKPKPILSLKKQKADLDKVVKREGVPDLDCDDCGLPKLTPSHKCETNGSSLSATALNQQSSLELYFTEYAHLTSQSIITIDTIKDKLQLRNKNSEAHIDYLAKDITQNGLKNAIDVIQTSNGNFMLLDGNHRLAAFVKLGLKEIKANILESANVFEQKLSAYLANVNRLEYTAAEHSRIISDLFNDAKINDPGISIRKFASDTLKKPYKTIQEFLQLAQLHPSILEKIEKHDWPKKRALAMSTMYIKDQEILIGEFYNNNYTEAEIKDRIKIWNHLSESDKTNLFAGDESWDSLRGAEKEDRGSGVVVYRRELCMNCRKGILDNQPSESCNYCSKEFHVDGCLDTHKEHYHQINDDDLIFCIHCNAAVIGSEIQFTFEVDSIPHDLNKHRLKEGRCKECHSLIEKKIQSKKVDPLDFETVDRKQTSEEFQCATCHGIGQEYNKTGVCITCHIEHEKRRDSDHSCIHCSQAVEQQSDIQQLEKQHDNMLQDQVINDVDIDVTFCPKHLGQTIDDKSIDDQLLEECENEFCIVNQIARAKEREKPKEIKPLHISYWSDKFETTHDVYNHSSENMQEIKDNSVHLVFTSPPYNANQEYSGKDKNADSLPWVDYIDKMMTIVDECFRVLVPGGRLVINVANLMRPSAANPEKRFMPLGHVYREIALGSGFMMLGEFIWYKAANLPTTWGSYCQPSLPHIRDSHEFVLVFSKPKPDENNIGWLVPLEKPEIEDINAYKISKDDFHAWTQSIWKIAPASDKGHPCIFPPELARRIISLFTYPSQIVLDPFGGSGTVAAVAKELYRSSISYEIEGQFMPLIEEKVMRTDIKKWFYDQPQPMIKEDLEEGSS